MVPLKKSDVKQIIAEKLTVPLSSVSNVALAIDTKRSEDIVISVFNDAIKRAMTSGLYVLLCSNFTHSTEWLYDIETSVAFYIPPDFFNSIVLSSNSKTEITVTQFAHKTDVIDSTEEEVFEYEDIVIENADLKDAYDMDRSFNKLSKREYVCILLKVPESGTPWIDSLIKKSLV